MKKQFQSKSVPRGTRTIWRYLGALFILFTFAIGNVWADEATFTESNLNVPKTVGSITLSVPTSNGFAYSSNKLSAGGSNKYFKLTASGATISQVVIYTDNNNNRFSQSNITNCTNLSSTSVSSKKVYTCSFSTPQAEISFKNNGGGVGVTSLVVTYSATAAVCPETLTISSKDSKTAFTEGDAIELTAALAKGNGDISYQWYKGGTAEGNKLTGKNTNKLQIASCTTADEGSYYCVASKTSCDDAVNTSGFAITVEADTKCFNMPEITSKPSDLAHVTVSGGTLSDVSTAKAVAMNAAGLKLDGNSVYLKVSLASASIVEGTKITVAWKGAGSGAGIALVNENLEHKVIDLTGISDAAGSISHTFTAAEAANYADEFIIHRNASGTGIYVNAITVEDCGAAVVKHTITLNYNDGVTDNGSIKVVHGNAATQPSDPERGKYTFLGWFVGDTDNEYVWSSIVNDDITLKAHWQDPWTISFDADGGSAVANITVKHNTKAEKPTDPTKDDNDFLGWFYGDPALEFDWDANVTQNYALVAHWQPAVAKYDVEYYDGDTKIGTEPQVWATGHPTATGIDTDKPLYTFVGWYLTSALEGDPVNLNTVTPVEGLKIYGKWAKAYATSVDLKVAATGSDEYTDVLDAHNIAYELTNTSWDEGTDIYNGLKIKGVNSYIKFNLKKGQLLILTVGYATNDVKIEVNDVDQSFVSSTTELSNFIYYAESSDVVITVTKTANQGTASSIRSITIRAPYQVSYDPHGADAIAAQPATPSVILPTPANGTGVFKGWYDAETGGNKIGNAGAEYLPTANITLHAQWETLSSDNTLASWKIDGVAKDVPVSGILYIEEPYGVTPVISEPVATANVGLETPIATVLYSNTPAHYQDETEDFWYVQAEVHPQDPNAAIGYYQVRYTNAPKLGATIFKAELTAANDADYSGLYVDEANSQIALAVDADNNNEYKFSGKSNFIKMAIADATFAEGDMLKMTYSTNPQQGELAIYDGSTKVQGTPYTNNILTFSDAVGTDKSTLYIRRTSDNNFNGWVAEVEVQRYMAPIIKSYKIGAVSGTIDQDLKTIAIELPYGTTLSGVAATIEAYANGGATVTAPTPLAYDTPLGYKVSGAYAEDGDVDYTVTITEAEASHEATLSDIKLDGVSLAGFDPATLSYNVELEKGTLAYPTVTYTAATGATVATDIADFPGAYKLVVTAEDGSTNQTYTINFTVSTKIKVVIYNGNAESAEAALKASPDVTTGASWSLVGSLTNDEKELAPYHYSILTNGSTSDTKHIAVTTPENYIPYFEIVQVTNSNNKDRRAFVALKKKASEVGETDSLLVVASSDIYTPVRGMSGALEEGKTYYIHATNSINFFEINLYLEPIPAKCEQPTITSQPATKTDFGAGNMTATVVAEVSDGGTLKYQWYNASDDSEVTGQTTATLTTAEEGTYYVIVTNTLDDHRDNSIKSDEAQLAHRVMNDATLSALSYGTPATAIALEADKYDYRVDLAMGTIDVPELTSTATMAPYSVVSITNATEFVNYEATSTVLVTAEDGVTQKTYTVKFVVDHIYTALVDVTGSTTWNWTGSEEATINDVANKGLILANYIDGLNFEKIEGKEGERARRDQNDGVYQGTHLHFNTTVPGKVKFYFRAPSSGEECVITVINNGKEIRVDSTGNSFKWSREVVVYGDVVIEMENKKEGKTDTRVQQIVFTEASPNYSRDVTNNIGTLCVDHNVLAGGALGATFYQIASRNELYNDKIDFEEVLPNEELKAGEPYIFQSTTGKIELFFGETEAENPVPVRGMIGNFAASTLAIDENNQHTILYIAQNKLWSCENLVGQNLILNDHRAYIDMTQVPTYANYQASLQEQQNPAPRRRVTLGKDAEQVVTGVENLNASEQPVKLLINGQIFILRGEKMFDATGRLVK